MSNSTRQDAQASTAGSSTVTVAPATDVTGAGPSQPPRNTVGVLKLRGGPSRRQRVVWSDETVDNEGMGKKKSKICCIYHKPRAFDESSSESDTTDDEHVKGKGRPKKKPEVESSESEGGAGSGAARPRRKAHRHTHCDGPKRDANKYDAKTTK